MAILKYVFRSRYRESSSKTINIGNIDKQFTHYLYILVFLVWAVMDTDMGDIKGQMKFQFKAARQ